MSGLEKRFLEKLGDDWESATPGFCIQAFSKGKKIVDIEVGETYKIYDLASLTKLLFTTSSLMFLHDANRFRTTDQVSKWVSWFPENYSAKIKDLLTHSAGLTWWYPFYKDVGKKTSSRTSPEEAWEIFQGILKERILKDMKGSPEKKKKIHPSLYSDLDFFMLGQVLESIAGTTLYTVWADARDRMGLFDTDFNRGNRPKFALKNYAPTERDDRRGGIMRGQVHDENTWSLKGVAPHAGLFGTLDDLSKWGLLLRSAMRGKNSKHFASSPTVKLFTHRAISRTRGDWALGFMLPGKDTPSAGPHFSAQSVGHTGFTGTSIWYDPKRDLLVTIVSNRVHPTRENKEYITLRPRLHSLIVEEL